MRGVRKWTTQHSAAKIFCSMSLLTLTACTSYPAKSWDSVSYSALCPKTVVGFHEEFTQADDLSGPGAFNEGEFVKLKRRNK